MNWSYLHEWCNSKQRLVLHMWALQEKKMIDSQKDSSIFANKSIFWTVMIQPCFCRKIWIITSSYQKHFGLFPGMLTYLLICFFWLLAQLLTYLTAYLLTCCLLLTCLLADLHTSTLDYFLTCLITYLLTCFLTFLLTHLIVSLLYLLSYFCPLITYSVI